MKVETLFNCQKLSLEFATDWKMKLKFYCGALKYKYTFERLL